MMKRKLSKQVFWSLFPLLIGVIEPSIVIFFLKVFVGHVVVSTAAKNTLQEFSYWLPLILFDLIPFAALSIVCFIAARRLSFARLTCLGVSGLIGILSLMITLHIYLLYPLYAPDVKTSSTAAIGLFFTPFYALVTLVIALFLGRCLYQCSKKFHF